MKFDMHQYWKHERCRDVFFSVRQAVFDDDGRNAILRGCWLTQGVEVWLFTVEDRIKITPENYGKWHPYVPKGRFKP